MSLVGKDVAIVSLGMSCQITYQLRKHAGLLAELTGDPDLREVGMPFDWVIRPPMNTVRAIQELLFFPESRHEITLNNKIPYWAKNSTLYWHDFNGIEGTDVIDVASEEFASDFDEAVQKYQHVTESFEALRSKKRNIFIISNVQNNLEEHDRNFGGIDYLLNKDNLGATAAAIAQRFPECSNEFLVVSYKDRIAPDIKLPNTLVALFSRDASEWEGSDANWGRLFRAYFAQASMLR